ncbi:MAG TPA: hemerythrin domain-containing protein [Polyangiaceae bacterium]|nr:hemerythrin domain-containing protein [Polyangiaceae bacterium]
MPNPLENVASKAAGKAAALSARAKGLSGVFATLAEQHREAGVLLKRAAGVDDVEKRRDLWSTLRRELLSHERGELNVVYPTLEQHPATRDIAQRHAADAHTLETTINEIDAAGCASPQWKPLLERLVTLVQHHVDEEEHEFFPRAQEAIGKDAASDLEAPFMAARERAMEGIR